MTVEPGREVLERLLEQGFDEAEVYVKRGRSRQFELTREGTAGAAARSPSETTITAEESGWSVRAGLRGSSFFFAAAGTPRPTDAWPALVDGGGRIELPGPSPIEGWSEAPQAAEPLLAEDEGWRLLRQVAADLERRLPSAAFEITLEDGSSEVHLWNHHGVDSGYRGRAASLRLEARASTTSRGPRATMVLAERSARHLPFSAIADRAVDLLAVRAAGSIGGAGDASMVLAPEVGARLLAPIVAAFVDRPRDAVAALLDARDDDRVGAPEITVIDDGRHPGGVLQAPIDGEGVPTGRRVLIEAGRLGETVMPWDKSGRALGSRARPSWRDLPCVALSHCFALPREEVAPSSLVGDLDDGFYLLDAGDGGSYDLAGGFFSLPVWGFRIAGGRPLHPLGEASLVGDPRRLLDAVCGVARDLRFVPHGVAMIGAPSLLVRGLSLRQGG